MARDLAHRFKLKLLEPETLVAEAIQAAEEWAAAHAPGACICYWGGGGGLRMPVHQCGCGCQPCKDALPVQ